MEIRWMDKRRKADDLDKILSEIRVSNLPKEYILMGFIRATDGSQYEISGDLVRTLLKNPRDFSEEDEEAVEELMEQIDDDQAEIELVVDINKLKSDINNSVNKLIKRYIRKK